MKVTTYTDLRKNLATMLDKVHADHEPLIVTRTNGSHAVVMSLADFNAYQETLYLTGSKANARRLQESIEQIGKGQTVVTDLDDLDRMAE